MTDKTVFRIVMALSVVVFVLVVLLNERIFPVPDSFPSFIYKLPLLNAVINGTCAVLLGFSYKAIRAKKVSTHKKLNLTTFFLSAIFLISYVCYHYFVGHTSYGGEGAMEVIYKIILFSHIILAAIVLPLVLLSFWHGLQNNIVKHRKIVRFAFPIWMYVAITGVVVYLMISPYYPY